MPGEPKGFGEPQHPPKQEQQANKFEEKKKRAQQMLDSRLSFLRTFSGRLPLEFKMDDSFGFDAESGTVKLDTNWVAEHDLTPDQMIWLAMNQVAGIREASEDKVALNRRLRFEQRSSHKRPRKLLRQTVDSIARLGWIQNKSINFREGRGADDVDALLEDHLVRGQDLTNLPKHLQFIEGLKRQEMLPEPDLKLDEDVDHALLGTVEFKGEEVEIADLVEEHILPNGDQSNLESRYQALEALEKVMLDFAGEDLEKETKGRDVFGEGAPVPPSDLPPEYKDEYIPQDMESKEGGEKEPTIFAITPGLSGYYRSVVKNHFDHQRKTWSNTARTWSRATESVPNATRTYSGKIRGTVALALPVGYTIDADSFTTTNGDIELMRDRYGNYYVHSDTVQEFSFQFGEQRFEDQSNPDEFMERLIGWYPTYEIESAMWDIEVLPDANAKADAIIDFIKKKYTYNVKAQGELFTGSTTVEDYFNKIAVAKELECYTSNTLFVALCRLLNVPARLEAGFHADQTEDDGTTAIRRSLGHAWASIWDGEKWVRKDATPPNSGSEYKEVYDLLDEEQSPVEVLDEARKDYVKQRELDEAEKKREEAEAQKRAQDALDEQWREKHNINPEVFRKFKNLEAKVQPQLDRLSRLWRRIAFGKGVGLRRELGGAYRTGENLNVSAAIQQWPSIQAGRHRQAELYERMEARKELIKQPELIRVRFVLDLSGSMFGEGWDYENNRPLPGDRIQALQRAYVLLNSSLNEFNRYLQMGRRQSKSNLKVETQSIAFGSSFRVIKDFDEASNLDGDWASVIEAFDSLNQDMGGTGDYNALNHINTSLSEKEKAQLKKGSILDLVIEITDGGSGNPRLARDEVDRLGQNNIQTAALLMGTTSQYDQRAFNEVWNDGRSKKLGYIIGSDMERMFPVLAEILEEHLGDVEL